MISKSIRPKMMQTTTVVDLIGGRPDAGAPSGSEAKNLIHSTP